MQLNEILGVRLTRLLLDFSAHLVHQVHERMMFRLLTMAVADSGLFNRPGNTFKNVSFNSWEACWEK